jgi:hypothetical protein
LPLPTIRSSVQAGLQPTIFSSLESDNRAEPDITTIDGFSSTLKVSGEGFGFAYHVFFRSACGSQVGLAFKCLNPQSLQDKNKPFIKRYSVRKKYFIFIESDQHTLRIFAQ